MKTPNKREIFLLPLQMAIVCTVVFVTMPAVALDFKLVPSVSLSEEYNDNLFQDAEGARADFVTRVQPSIGAQVRGGGFNCDLSYGLDYRNYARHSRDDEFDHRAAFKSDLNFREGFFRIDLRDTYSRVSLNVARDVVSESLVVNQTLQNVAYISPYLTWRVSANSTLKTGYRYVDTRYWDSDGIDKMEHDVFTEFSREIRTGLVLSAGYNFARTDADTTGFYRHDVYGGLKYDIDRGTFLYGKIGNNWHSFDNGFDTSDLFWDAGASRDFGFIVVALGTRVQYTEDPETLSTRDTSYYATLSRAFPRGAASFICSYSEYEEIELAQPDRKVLLAATGNYELRPDLMLKLSLSGDRLNQSEGTEYPYHLYGNFGFDYALSKQAALGVNYSRISYRNKLDSSEGSTDVNRFIAEVRLSL